VGQQAGLLKEGKLPRSGRALFADAAGTTMGAALGTSTVTCISNRQRACPTARAPVSPTW